MEQNISVPLEHNFNFYWTFIFPFLSFVSVAVVIMNWCCFFNLFFCCWSTDVRTLPWGIHLVDQTEYIYAFFWSLPVRIDWPVLWLSRELFAFISLFLMKDPLPDDEAFPCVMLHKWMFSFGGGVFVSVWSVATMWCNVPTPLIGCLNALHPNKTINVLWSETFFHVKFKLNSSWKP